MITTRPFYFKFQPYKITMDLGEYEPFFCVAALYDIGTKKKISENFDFNCNPEHLNAIVAGQVRPPPSLLSFFLAQDQDQRTKNLTITNRLCPRRCSPRAERRSSP